MGTQTWSGLDTPASFSQALDKVTTGTADEALTSEAQTFMMLPQRFPEGAQIEVLFTDDTHTGHTLIADIKGSEWPMGKTVTYKISSSSLNWTYTLDVTALADFTYAGGTQQYRVTSYRQKRPGGKRGCRMDRTICRRRNHVDRHQTGVAYHIHGIRYRRRLGATL